MSIYYLYCTYSKFHEVKIDEKPKRLLAMRWVICFTDGSIKPYQIAILPTRSLSSKKTYHQINNLDEVNRLKNQVDTIELTYKTEVSQKDNDSNYNDVEFPLVYINPKGFVLSEEYLFANGENNYFLIMKYLKKHILLENDQRRLNEVVSPRITCDSENQNEEPEDLQNEDELSSSKKHRTPVEETEDLQNVDELSSSKKHRTPVVDSGSKIQKKQLICCSNRLVVVSSIVFLVAALIFANFYNSSVENNSDVLE